MNPIILRVIDESFKRNSEAMGNSLEEQSCVYLSCLCFFYSFCLQCALLAQILPILQDLNSGGTLFKRTIILWSGNFSTNLPMVMRCCGPELLKIMVFLSRYSSPLCEELQMFSLGCCQDTLGWRELRGYGWGANSTGYTSILPRIKSHNQPFLLCSLPPLCCDGTICL